MQTKTYFANSVPAALEAARRDLGPEAMLVGSKQASAEARAFGRLEVTFAFDPKATATASTPYAAAPLHVPERAVFPSFLTAATRASKAAAGSEPGTAPTSRSELDELRQQIAALRAEVGNAGASAPPARLAGPPAFGEYLSAAVLDLPAPGPGGSLGISEYRLCANGLGAATAREIADGAARRSGDRESALLAELTNRIPVAPFDAVKPGEGRALSFVGPAGRGKTTSLVKIAVRYGIARRVPVRIYSAGAHGIGSQEQMARYATILGVPFQACESLESLQLALNGGGWKGLILIDSPGLSPADKGEIATLGSFFARLPEIEKHLVLRADARTADMVHMVSGFAGMAPSRLLFTGLDEALTLGALVETLMSSGIPASLAGTGQQIPEDLEEADAAGWAGEICGGYRLAAAAA